MEREPNTQYVLSLSYGKDSIATIEACKRLGYPIDRIIHAEIWATDDIHADLPPMVEFKSKADAIIKERYGIEVEHVCAMAKDGTKQTYEKLFYHIPKRRKAERERETIYGFPQVKGNWCTQLKTSALRISQQCRVDGALVNSRCPRYEIKGFPGTAIATWCKILKIQPMRSDRLSAITYLGIAADEPQRIERHQNRQGITLPLVDIGWTEADCRKWCEENDLLSPIYTTSARGGCWFCHNQGIEQMRLLRKNYPQLWELLLKWDLDSPVTFKADGHTVHDFDERFALEDEDKVPKDRTFRWWMVEDAKNNDQLTFDDL